MRDAVARTQSNGFLPAVGLPEVAIERPGKPEQGDFATSFALRAKRAVGPRGPAPLDIASAISAQIVPEMPAYLSGCEAAPPGFLNFTLADDWLRAEVDVILSEGPAYGSVPLGGGARVQVEFVSANPTGPLHVGHARNASLGDSLARVLALAGWDVQREYYYNDAGAQMEHLAHSVWVRYQQVLGLIPPGDDALGADDYAGEYVTELAQDIVREHGDRFVALPTAEADLGDLASRRVMEWIDVELERARVRFDNKFSEARVIREGDFQRVLDLLKEHDLVYEREGALFLKTQSLGDERDRVMIRSDGRPTYTATDIAYHYDKFFIRHFDRVIDVWGSDHQGQVPSMQAIVRHLGAEPEQFEILIHQMVSVLRNGAPVRMSKRAGNFVTMSEVMDAVGVDAMRWYLVSSSADSAIRFDLDVAARQSSENPVYYVQYAHARLARVLASASSDVDWQAGNVGLLTHPSELALVRRMLQLPEVVELAARTLAPHHIPHYAYELARATQSWYDAGDDDRSLRILCEDIPLQAARLKLAAAARQVLANALDAIGVQAPDSM